MPKPIRFAASLTFIGVFISLLASFAAFRSYSQSKPLQRDSADSQPQDRNPTGTVSGTARNGRLSTINGAQISTENFNITSGSQTELAVDDGAFETTFGLGGPGTIWSVNRLTPNSYPATLDAVSIFFHSASNLTVGAPLTIVFGANPSGGTSINGIQLQTRESAVQAVGQFNVFNVPPLTINSGDFVVGYRITIPLGVHPVALDTTPLSQGRSYVSPDGVTYSMADGALLGNYGIRAQMQTQTQNDLFTTGDLFVSINNGRIQWRRANGTLVQTLDTREGGIIGGMAFDKDNNLYATSFTRNKAHRFSPAGLLLGTFGSGYNCFPESIVFDQAGNVYVGQAGPQLPPITCSRSILKFDATGNLLATFTPATERRGTDWIELAEDQCTLFYTSEGRRIKRFNVCANTQLSDFVTGLPGTIAYALRLLPSGGLIVADNEVIVRLDANGAEVSRYDAAGENSWFAINLDPDGKSFWSAGILTGNVYKFDLATGNQLLNFNTGTPPQSGLREYINGLAILGEITRGGPQADLAITKTSQPNPAPAGSNLTYTMTVTNNGPLTANSVTVADDLPAGTTFVSCNATGGGVCGGTGNNRTITFNSLASGASATITLVANVNCSGGNQITNTATVKSAVSDPNPDNNSATAVTGCGFSCPVIEAISPTSGRVGAAVTITGRNFTGVNSVKFANNVAAAFTVSGDTQITATVPNGAVSGPITISKPNCPDATTAVFTVINPQGPTLTALIPNSAIAGGPGFTLTAIGSNFVPNSIVQWNGAPRTTTFVSATQLLAEIFASDISAAGAVPVTVINPPPGGGVSNALNFTIITDQPQAGAAVIIDGTDANEHGGVSSGANVRGWLYMQKALENLAARVAPGTAKVVVDLGGSSGTGRNAINSAFSLSSLPGAGWTIRHEDGAANITNWLANISTTNTGILYIPTYNLTGGDLDAQEMAAINAQAGRIAGFMSLNPGGALFAMGEVGAGSWDWLRALYPGIVVTDVGGSGVTSNITMTPAGMTAFPGLTNSDLAGADPWHNYFTGDLGNLNVLATAIQSGVTRQVILGGLRIVPPTPRRTVRIVCPPSAGPGGMLTLPIELVSEGNENALGFSLNFDPAVLGNPQVALGGDANNATLNMNTSQVAQGRLGVALALPSGQTFAAGARRIAVVTFAVSAATAATSTAVTFGDAPIRREVSNANAQVLPVIFDACLNIPITEDGFEADVAPRPNGSGAVTVTDWVQVGRFAAGLDTVTAGGEFQRADCAPRDTRGDGRLSIADWVQAGRYAAGLDSAQPAGGPSSPSAFAPENVAQAGAENSHGRVIRALNATFQRGQPNTLEIEIEAEGDENALGFSLNFDPSALAFVSASAGGGADGALLNVNENQTANGRLGVALALPAGRTLKAGKQTVVTVRFNSLASSGVTTTPISFGDQPIRRELSDVNAVAVAASYSDGSVNIVNSVASVSAASFKPEIAAESIVAAFGASLATATAMTTSLPLPTSLAGTTVKVRDSAGVERLAPLFFAAPAQVNYQMPPGTAAGASTVTVTSGNGTASAGTVNITPVAPSLFGANADGQGVGATVAVRVRADGSQVFENTARFDPARNRFDHEPIDLGPENEQVVLLLFGTGFRNRSALSAVSVSVGGVNMPVDYAGPQPDFAGLDQVNVRLLRGLIGLGEVDIVVTVDGKTANTIKTFIK